MTIDKGRRRLKGIRQMMKDTAENGETNWDTNVAMCDNDEQLIPGKDENISFDEYINTWILRIYRRYIGGYFYMNIDISEIKLL